MCAYLLLIEAEQIHYVNTQSNSVKSLIFVEAQLWVFMCSPLQGIYILNGNKFC